jgi:hypothetical protein
MLRWFARVILKSRIIELVLSDIDDKLAKALNERIDVPGLDEEQEQKLFDNIIDAALDVVADVLEDL